MRVPPGYRGCSTLVREGGSFRECYGKPIERLIVGDGVGSIHCRSHRSERLLRTAAVWADAFDSGVARVVRLL